MTYTVSSGTLNSTIPYHTISAGCANSRACEQLFCCLPVQNAPVASVKVVTGADHLVRRRRYCDHCHDGCICVCGCVCQQYKAKTADRNDLKQVSPPPPLLPKTTLTTARNLAQSTLCRSLLILDSKGLGFLVRPIGLRRGKSRRYASQENAHSSLILTQVCPLAGYLKTLTNFMSVSLLGQRRKDTRVIRTANHRRRPALCTVLGNIQRIGIEARREPN